MGLWPKFISQVRSMVWQQSMDGVVLVPQNTLKQIVVHISEFFYHTLIVHLQCFLFTVVNKSSFTVTVRSVFTQEQRQSAQSSQQVALMDSSLFGMSRQAAVLCSRNICRYSLALAWKLTVNSVFIKGKKADIALPGNPISELQDITCHMRSQCYLPPDTSEHALPTPEGWKAELT